MFRKLNLFVIGALLGAVVFITPATSALADDNCGMTVERVYRWCEYYDWQTQSMEQREGFCQNGDDLVLNLVISPGCWLESGVVTVTALHPDYAYNMSWLARPRYLRFTNLEPKYVRVKLKGIYLYTDNEESSWSSIPVQIVPVSSQNAAIVDEVLHWVGWQAEFINAGGDGGGGKG